MKYFKLYIFDLDGTLVDSLSDICFSLNLVMEGLGRPPHSNQAVKRMLGYGTRYLLERALATRDKGSIDRAVSAFKIIYQQNVLRSTKPYPGIVEVLHQLRNRGADLAIASNKSILLVNGVLEGLGLSDLFTVVLGGDSLAVSKPQPEFLHHILSESKVSKDKAVMVGDMDIDVLAGKAVNIQTAGVMWGYGNIGQLEEALPDYLLQKPQELLKS